MGCAPDRTMRTPAGMVAGEGLHTTRCLAQAHEFDLVHNHVDWSRPDKATAGAIEIARRADRLLTICGRSTMKHTSASGSSRTLTETGCITSAISAARPEPMSSAAPRLGRRSLPKVTLPCPRSSTTGGPVYRSTPSTRPGTRWQLHSPSTLRRSRAERHRVRPSTDRYMSGSSTLVENSTILCRCPMTCEAGFGVRIWHFANVSVYIPPQTPAATTNARLWRAL